MQTRTQELMVGAFMILGLLAVVFLALRVSGLSGASSEETYRITAKFENIGGLTTRAKVTMAGVTVGRVANIYLDRDDYVGVVVMDIYERYDNLSTDTSAAILTAGLLGEKYIGLTVGAELENLQAGDEIFNTQSALVLEDLIGKFVSGRMGGGGSGGSDDEDF